MKRDDLRRGRGTRRLLSIAAVLGAGACAETVPGTAPPLDQLYFPFGLAAVEGQGGQPFLLVSSTNFDQRFNAGTLVSLSVDRLLAQIGDPAPGEVVFRTDFGDALAGGLRMDQLGGQVTFSPGAGGAGRVYVPTRFLNRLNVVDFAPNGALSCGNGGQDRALETILGQDCTEGRSLPTGYDDPFVVAVASLPGADAVVGVAHLRPPGFITPAFGNVSFALESAIDARLAAERAGQPLPDPLVRGEVPQMGGSTGLTALPPFDTPADPFRGFLASGRVGAPDFDLVLAQLLVGLPAAEGEPLSVQSGWIFSLSAATGANSTRGLAVGSTSGPLRAYLSLRFPEATDTFNAGIAVMRVDPPELLQVFELGEELQQPFLLERGNQRLIYVADLRGDRIWILDVSTDQPVVAGSILGRMQRIDGEGRPFQAHVLSTPSQMAFVEREGRHFAFVTNFNNSTLAVLDVTDVDPRRHRQVARFGRTIDPLGETEDP